MELEDYISPERLKIYTDVLKLKPGEELGGYNWNKTLSGAMQPLMHCLEVTLRNAIDHAIRRHPLPGAVDHWRTDANWIFDLPRYIGDKTWIRQGNRYKKNSQGQVIYRRGQPVYDKTAWEEDCIRKVSKRIREAGKAPTAERLISGLDFGFWTNFLTHTYDEPRKYSLLWPQLLPEVFPGAPAGTPRHVLEKKFTRIRDLRNRLAHHEAIWKFQEVDPSTGKPDYSRPVYGLNASLRLLRRAWNDILEALYWVSPARHASFISEEHHMRFEALATQDGLYSFIGRGLVTEELNVRRSRELRKMLRMLRQKKILKLTTRGSVVAIIGPDFIRQEK
ncbi:MULTISPECIES: Abi family protein [Pectobacterium]|uniref:CAAX protease n=1 Tax=Pectobacterium aquaticum TaxID=2204145 RepID=A0AA93ANC9_9GAMM|nr:MULTISPECIES: Abi family protein [Pectobacterium]MBA0170453.1 Abi family protein [Pectobacterium versatile]MBE5221362.1 Abi family protein [Pectobacterium quasiaquaticum]QHP79382.1 CAAX protease [Pectobacterium odoriferum]RRO08309.1 CAAX protease [Pectobacterium aquaticum]RRO22443.1 CAAX protease [Pectobacterium aquaticum]